VEKAAKQESPLASLVHRLPRSHVSETEPYLALLDRVLEDRLVTDDEVTELTSVALSYGLSVEEAEQAHQQYLGHLAGVVWNDGVVTDQERADFNAVAHLLLIPSDEAERILEGGRAQPAARGVGDGLRAGDRVVFTGEMHHTRAEIESIAEANGLLPTSSVSKKTALVVVADPHSQSGKAKKARELGVRVVTEQVFLNLIDGLGTTTAQVPSLR
jgi:DNA polymerase-3 subunit epsilon